MNLNMLHTTWDIIEKPHGTNDDQNSKNEYKTLSRHLRDTKLCMSKYEFRYKCFPNLLYVIPSDVILYSMYYSQWSKVEGKLNTPSPE